MKVAGGLVRYQYLDAMDMVDHDHLTGVVKKSEICSCGGRGVCTSCNAIEAKVPTKS